MADPEIRTKLTADIDDFLAKMGAAKAAVEDFKKSASKSGDPLKNMGKDADKGAKDTIKALDRLKADMGKSGQGNGKSFAKSFWDGFTKELARSRKAHKEGGQITTWLPFVGVGLSTLPNLLTGVLGLIGAFGALGIAAGVGLGAMAIAAKAALGPILAAYKATGKAKQADIKALDPEQLTGFHELVNFMTKLKSMTVPDVLPLFGQAIGIASKMLKYFNPIADKAIQAVGKLLDSFNKGSSSAGFHQFMSSLLKLEGPAITDLGKSIGEIGIAIGNMFVAIQKSGLANMVGKDVVGMLHSLDTWTGGQGFINFLKQAKADLPGLGNLVHSAIELFGALFKSLSGGLGRDEVTIISGLAKALAGLLNLPGVGPFVGNMIALALVFSKFGTLGAATGILRGMGGVLKNLVGRIIDLKGAKLALSGVGEAVKGLAAGETTVKDLGFAFKSLGTALTGGAIVAGITAIVIGLVALSRQLDKTAPSGQKVVNSLRQMDGAVNFNIAGYKKLAQQTNINTSAGQRLVQKIGALTQAARSNYGAIKTVTNAHTAAAKAASNLTGHLAQVERAFGVTRRVAILMSGAAGVAASKMAEGGKAGQAAAQKVIDYANSVGFLNKAFQALVSPQLGAIQAAIQYHGDMATLATDLKISHGRVGDFSAATRQSATDMVNAAEDAQHQAAAIKQNGGSMDKARGIIRGYITALEGMHAKGADVNQTLRVMRAYLATLRSKTITITANVQVHQSGTIPGGGGHYINPGQGHAAGTRSAAPGWALVGERGPEWMNFNGGEAVLPHGVSPRGGSSSGSSAAVPVVIQIDGREIYRATQVVALKHETRNGKGNNGYNRKRSR